jgi:hypothetical protein
LRAGADRCAFFAVVVRLDFACALAIVMFVKLN